VFDTLRAEGAESALPSEAPSRRSSMKFPAYPSIILPFINNIIKHLLAGYLGLPHPFFSKGSANRSLERLNISAVVFVFCEDVRLGWCSAKSRSARAWRRKFAPIRLKGTAFRRAERGSAYHPEGL
jgi:hypothetical protein